MFKAIQQQFFLCVYSEKIRQIPKEKIVVDFFLFGRVVGWKHLNLMKWNSNITLFFGIFEIIFWFIFQKLDH